MSQTVTSIGRSSASDIVLKDVLVSRTHALIHCVDGEFFVEDKCSTNGTIHNEQLVALREQLNDGDKIRIGTTWFAFSVEAKGIDDGVDTEQMTAHPAAAESKPEQKLKALLRNISSCLRHAS